MLRVVFTCLQGARFLLENGIYPEVLVGPGAGGCGLAGAGGDPYL